MGSSITTYDVSSLSMINSNDLGPNNTRIITPKYIRTKARKKETSTEVSATPAVALSPKEQAAKEEKDKIEAAITEVVKEEIIKAEKAKAAEAKAEKEAAEKAAAEKALAAKVAAERALAAREKAMAEREKAEAAKAEKLKTEAAKVAVSKAASPKVEATKVDVSKSIAANEETSKALPFKVVATKTEATATTNSKTTDAKMVPITGSESTKVVPKKKETYVNIDIVTTYERVLEKGYKSADMLKKVADRHFLNNELEQSAKWYDQLYELKTEDLDPVFYYRYSKSLEAVNQLEKSKEMMAIFLAKNN